MIKTHLGILVRYNTNRHPPFTEKSFFKLLTQYARRVGIEVTVFSPLSVNWSSRSVSGYRYDPAQKKWVRGFYPLPTVLYDRIAYSKRSQMQQYHPLIRRLEKENECILLGKGLPGKWIVYNMLRDHEHLQRYLPETNVYRSHNDWRKHLATYGALFFKPASGSHGRGVFCLRFEGSKYVVQGRDAYNRLFEKRFAGALATNEWIKRFTSSRLYIFQPFLHLNTADQQPFDIRVLVQKDSKGVWKETGRAVRVGKKDSLTSNLDGGGTAIDATKFLEKHFTPVQMKRMNEAIDQIVTHLPQTLEERHGSLVELGIDIGIDREQRVWILEVNSKPGRKAFKLAQNQKAFQSALITPVQYAEYVVSQSGGHPQKWKQS
jgi:glutathione synthase/RimK-type ligase-like ATP-grasp enzyme